MRFFASTIDAKKIICTFATRNGRLVDSVEIRVNESVSVRGLVKRETRSPLRGRYYIYNMYEKDILDISIAVRRPCGSTSSARLGSSLL